MEVEGEVDWQEGVIVGAKHELELDRQDSVIVDVGQVPTVVDEVGFDDVEEDVDVGVVVAELMHEQALKSFEVEPLHCALKILLTRDGVVITFFDWEREEYTGGFHRDEK
jgi:hypothetical protein